VGGDCASAPLDALVGRGPASASNEVADEDDEHESSQCHPDSQRDEVGGVVLGALGAVLQLFVSGGAGIEGFELVSEGGGSHLVSFVAGSHLCREVRGLYD